MSVNSTTPNHTYVYNEPQSVTHNVYNNYYGKEHPNNMDVKISDKVSTTGKLPYETPPKVGTRLKGYIKKPFVFMKKRPGFIFGMTMMLLTCGARISSGNSDKAGHHPAQNQQSVQWIYNKGAQSVRDSIEIANLKQQRIQDSLKIADLEKKVFELAKKTSKKMPK